MNRQEYIELLITKKDWSNSPYADRIRAIENGAECKNPSAMIDHLKSMPWKPFPKNEDPVTEIGIYRNSAGDVFKVNCSKNTGKLYAVILWQMPNGIWEWDWDNTPKGAIYKLHSADKWQMTIQEAKAFGLKYTMCGICGRKLHNAISKKLLIGPVCGEREFGDEFKAMHRNAKAELAAEQNTILESDSDSELELMF